MACFFKIFKPLRALLTSAVLSCCLVLPPAAGAAADESGNLGGKPEPGGVIRSAPAAPDLKFEVKVSTSSGSASTSPETEPVPLKPKLPAAPAVSSAPPPPPARTDSGEAGAEGAMSPKRRAVFAALDSWHKENLANYNYNIAGLYDPFMPIKEVRGKPEEIEGIDPEEEAKLPPVLKLELSQLKLVAITTVTGRDGSALASFEDGAGSSYILRQSDRIGRRRGHILRIEPNQVIVEEPPRGSSKEPQITVMKLDALDNSGLSYTDGGN